MRGGVQIHPVLVTAPSHAISAVGNALALQSKAALQTAQVDATCGIEIDLHLRHSTTPNPGSLDTKATGQPSSRTAARTCEIYPAARVKFTPKCLCHQALDVLRRA